MIFVNQPLTQVIDSCALPFPSINICYCLLFYLVCGQGMLPSFSWKRVSGRQTAIPSIKITFPDGTDDFAVLQHYNPIAQGRDEQEEDIDHCIFDGYLLNEVDVYVTVTGCQHADNFGVIPCKGSK